MFCCALLYVHSSFAIIQIGKRELIALLSLSSWCFAIVEGLDGGLVITIHEKFNPLFISLKCWVIH